MASKKCPQCAESVRAEAKVCRFCSYSFPIPAPELAKSQMGWGKKIGIGFAVLLGFQMIAFKNHGGPAPGSAASPTPISTPPPSEEITANVASNALLKETPAKQAQALGKVVGDHCHGMRAFYDGIGHDGVSRDQAFWSLACKDGRTFMIMLSPSDHENKVMECSLLKAVNAGECFTHM